MRFVIGFTLAMACGLGFLFYPSGAKWYNEAHSAKTISGFNAVTHGGGLAHQDLVTAAREYNKDLTELGIAHLDGATAANDKRYQSQLRIEGTEVMATLRIPGIDTSVPVYHTSKENVLERGAEHIYGSALPVGGSGTHSVITAHSGAVHARLFNYLHEMEIGDDFFVTTGGQTLRYVVDQITVIHPDDLSNLQPVHGEDYLTLVTCTPIGINSHRLLVRGTRAPLVVTPAAGLFNSNTPFPWWAVWYAVATAGAFTLSYFTLRLGGGKQALKSPKAAAAKARHAGQLVPAIHSLALPLVIASLSLVPIAAVPQSASAATGSASVTLPNLRETGSLTVSKHLEAGMAPATQFTITQVLGDANGNFNLGSAAGWQYVTGLTYADLKSPMYGDTETAAANAQGTGIFTNLVAGVYLVTETDGAAGAAVPALITVPSIDPDTGLWNYSVVAELKTLPVSAPPPAKLAPTPAATATSAPAATAPRATQRLFRTGVSITLASLGLLAGGVALTLKSAKAKGAKRNEV